MEAGNLKLSETATGDVQWNKVFLEILQISQESLFNNVTVLRDCNFIKKVSKVLSCEICEIFRNNYFQEHLWRLLLNLLKNRLQHSWFPVNFLDYSRASILKSTYERLVLKDQHGYFSWIKLQALQVGCV